MNARLLQRPLSLFRPASKGKRVADDFAVMTVNDRRQVAPAIWAERDVGYAHRPPFVACGRTASSASHARSKCNASLIDEPRFQLQHPIDGLEIHLEVISKAKKGPQPAIAEGRMLFDEAPNTPLKHLVEPRFSGS